MNKVIYFLLSNTNDTITETVKKAIPQRTLRRFKVTQSPKFIINRCFYDFYTIAFKGLFLISC
jgi:hypothetical protein